MSLANENKMQKKPSVSIGMPVYNGEAYIREALDSLLAQEYEDFELIISDNGSTDLTQDICLEYAQKDQRIHFHKNETNLGALINFTKVLNLSVAEYFMWAAHDDIWEPKYISTLMSAFEANSNIILAFPMFNSIDENGKEITSYPHVAKIPSADLTQRLINYLMQPEHLGKANPIYGITKKSAAQYALKSTMNFLDNRIFAADMLFVFELLTLGDLSISPDTLFHKRITPSGFSIVTPTYEDWNSYFNGYKELVDNNSNLTPNQKNKINMKITTRRRNLIYRYPLSGIVALLNKIAAKKQ